MTDIVIYTTPAVLLHKQKLDGDINEDETATFDPDASLFYWRMRRQPRHLEPGERIYFATKGAVRGSFELEHFDADGNPEWWWGSWRDAEEPITVAPFRGFRYRWWGAE